MLMIAASILAARKLANYDGGKRVPATMSAIADAVRWAEEIMKEIDLRWPGRASSHYHLPCVALAQRLPHDSLY